MFQQELKKPPTKSSNSPKTHEQPFKWNRFQEMHDKKKEKGHHAVEQTTQLPTVKKLSIKEEIPQGWRRLTMNEGKQYKAQLTKIMERWSIVGFEKGAFDGHGYGCNFREEIGSQCGQIFILKQRKNKRKQKQSEIEKQSFDYFVISIIQLNQQKQIINTNTQLRSLSNNISSNCMYKLSPQKFPSCISKYTLEYLIASGTFGRVYMATSGGKKYAIKQMVEPTKVYYKQQMQNQIKVLTQMNHENIVKLYEVIRDRSYVYLVMQFCQSDLREFMSESGVGFSEEIAISIFTQIVNGMNQLVKLHIVHRDLKPANILVSKGIYKIADFGLAKYIQDECQMLKTRVGTPFYMAPQILKNQRYTSKCDIWSLGVIFFQLCFGTLPWYATSQDELLFNIYSYPLVFPKKVSNKIRKLLEGMIAIQEYHRFSWEDLIKQLSTVDNQPQLHVELQKSFHKSTMNKLLQIEFNRLSIASYGRKFDMLKSQEKKSIAGLIPKLFNQQSNEICSHFIRAKLKA